MDNFTPNWTTLVGVILGIYLALFWTKVISTSNSKPRKPEIPINLKLRYQSRGRPDLFKPVDGIAVHGLRVAILSPILDDAGKMEMTENGSGQLKQVHFMLKIIGIKFLEKTNTVLITVASPGRDLYEHLKYAPWGMEPLA